MKDITLSEFLGDLTPDPPGSLKGGKPVTIWLPADDKARYDRIQQKSGRKFSKKLREFILQMIEAAEPRSS